MIRKLLLGLSILAMMAAPMPAWARGEHGPEVHAAPAFHGTPEVHGRPAFHGHERFVPRPLVIAPFVGVYASPYVVAPPCGWQSGYWAEQTYTDAYGNASTVPQWVPPQYVCS
jgi:hypothetical protein